ncbi:MAG TPA: TonB-dependent receptor [Bacteroidales bacterium]|nr:TonB-dependent receptor [Bacteroidales bacterium]HPA28607.1 TonB-dependent receptor [Bacteroidales bacterium]HQF18175.1 TonB-dependent receptor [Bacteroidales bacterium]HQI63485.1 TonB-dependent receptor [Bacteroidales bacterium]HRC66408.1 TonB-dependent receptor [Bacteroidales bacterium]
MRKFIVLSSCCMIWGVFIFSGLKSWAQEASIRGVIYEKESGEPAIFVNVFLGKTTLGSATDVNGYYIINNIPAGSYNLMVTGIGYDSLVVPITIRKGEIITRKLYISKKSIALEGVSISAEREAARTETRTSVVKVTPRQIKQIPSIGGQPDLAQYLQVLPGVVFTGDQGGQLYIRGGAPIQNKLLLDGMVIYNPFHSIGLFSVFDTDILRNADIYTGGFGAEFGGRISSVMDLTTRDGNKKRLSGKIDASTFGAKLLLEGPISKQKEDNSGSSSFILSVKNSYLEETSKTLYKYVNEDGLPFNFFDIYGKVSFNADNGSKVNLFGFNFTDRVNNYKALSDFHWDAIGGGTNFVVIPGKTPVLLEGVISYSNYKVSLKETGKNDRTSQIGGFNAGLNFTYFINKDELRYGFEFQGFNTDYYFFNSLNRVIQQKENTTEIGPYVKYKMHRGKFLIEPGLRIQWYTSLSNISPEPRLAIKYNVNDRLRIKGAGGFYSQNLISATSDRDVVNLFYGFLSGPDNLPEEFNGEKVTDKLQKAWHTIGGIELDLSNNVTMNIEAYYKKFTQLTNINRNKIFDDTEIFADQPDELKNDFIIETGDAKGLDISIKFENDRFYFWGVYSLGYVSRFDGNNTYSPHFDRRHTINLVAAVYFGSARDWELSSRWNFGSGFPFTQSQGYFEKITFENGIYSNPATENGNLAILYAELNTGRLPVYHRLDIDLKHKWELSQHSHLQLNIGATNIYDRENIFYFDRIAFERVYQLPVMYNVGFTFSF